MGGAIDPRGSKLRRLLLGFCVALAIPSIVLTWQAHSRLRWEAFHQYQALAEEWLDRLDDRLHHLVEKEASRAFTDYRFLVVEGAPGAGYFQRSPLSGFPVAGDLPGLLGYFQVDAEGRFTTPLLPEHVPRNGLLEFGVSDEELAQRRALGRRLLDILRGQGSVQAEAAAETAPASVGSVRQDDMARAEAETGPPVVERGRVAQATFDRLSAPAPQAASAPAKSQGSAADFADELQAGLAQALEPAERKLRQKAERRPRGSPRREKNVVPVTPAPTLADNRDGVGEAPLTPVVRFFESEIDPFEFAPIGSTHFVLYRKVWREGRRTIQGLLFDRPAFLDDLFAVPFRGTVLAGMSRLSLDYDDTSLATFEPAYRPGASSSAGEMVGRLLYRGRLSAPFGRMGLQFTVASLPPRAGARWVLWSALSFALVLVAGLYLLYRLGLKQIELNRQQRDFVSAVSHELKTPLTSIRMYSEMLREGWADESRRQTYYRFIQEESERLSRLISNVLQLARMERDDLRVSPKPVPVERLVDLLRSKVSDQIERAGFEMSLDCQPQAAARVIEVDEDALMQVLINLVDNAIKFSSRAALKRVDLGCRLDGSARVVFSVADHGPGIPPDQMKKIFRLFYRAENELTRETVGTGIGLALVHRLTRAMGGEVDAANRQPGVEFRISFLSLTRNED